MRARPAHVCPLALHDALPIEAVSVWHPASAPSAANQPKNPLGAPLGALGGVLAVPQSHSIPALMRRLVAVEASAAQRSRGQRASPSGFTSSIVVSPP